MFKHEWVEECDKYEAVLVCTNPLPGWDDVSTMRAFQTYLWSDTTINKEVPSFAHIETGTFIRHEGQIVAIEYGQGKLTEALPDLFLALNALGWTSAEVYHPIETLDELMSDMGRSIPASMDFDVCPAKMDLPISEFIEGHNLLAHGRPLPGGDLQSKEAMAADEKVVLSEIRDINLHLAEGSLLAAPSPIILIDDTENDAEIESGKVTVAQLHTTKPKLNTEEQPIVFLIPDVDVVPPTPPMRLVKDEQLGKPPLLVNEAPSLSRATEIKLVTNQQKQASATVQHKPITTAPIADLPAVLKAEDTPRLITKKLVKIGQSVICFDLPCTPMLNDEVRVIAGEYSVPLTQVVHIRPGAIKDPVRWDVLGEIDPDYPWFAERLVSAMQFQADGSLIASIILALKKNNSKSIAELRDVLMFAGQDIKEMGASLKTVSLAAELLLMHALKRDGVDSSRTINATMDAIVARLGALALSPIGQSFVDLLDGPEEFAEGVREVFTIRSVIHSSAPRVFVVHVDVMDGPFVVWLADLLHEVAVIHAAAKRFTKSVVVDEVETIQNIHEPVEKTTLITPAVNKVLGDLFGQLQQLGIDIPLPAKN